MRVCACVCVAALECQMPFHSSFSLSPSLSSLPSSFSSILARLSRRVSSYQVVSDDNHHYQRRHHHHRRRRRRRGGGGGGQRGGSTESLFISSSSFTLSPPRLVNPSSVIIISLLLLLLLFVSNLHTAQALSPRLPSPAADHNNDPSLNEYNIFIENLNRTLNSIYSTSSIISSTKKSLLSSNPEYDFVQFMQYSAEAGSGLSFNYVGDQQSPEEESMRSETIFYPSDVTNNKATRNANSGGQCYGDMCIDGIFKWHRSKVKNIYVGGIFPMVYYITYIIRFYQYVYELLP